MIGCSLRHRGEELLGQRAGLAAYVAERKTMGIPLLYPWANRLSERRFSLAGREIVIAPGDARPDEHGLPMHGLLAAAPGWEVVRHEAAALVTRFAFAARDAFPFAHELELEATLHPQRLTVAITVHASTDAPVPIAFGFHPYLQLPGVERARWRVEIPVREQLRLDERKLPTGERFAVSVEAGPLGERTFDDAYVAPDAPFALEGPDRRIELAFEAGYPYAQVFAPPGDALIAFEPMTAPTNALVSGHDLKWLEPGERFRAAFSIAVSA
jgi:galactose mutarotase-like enzyme